MTTKDQIRSWFDRGVANEADFMIVKWDSFDGPEGDYPVYVYDGADPRRVAAENGDRTMECYCLTMDREMQMSEHRAFHWEREDVSTNEA